MQLPPLSQLADRPADACQIYARAIAPADGQAGEGGGGGGFRAADQVLGVK